MDINLIKRLIKLVENSKITDFEVEEGELKVKISKRTETIVAAMPQHVEVNNPAVSSPVTNPVVKSETSSAVEKPIEENLHEIKSPIVGTFYRAPAPDADPYVKVGDQVSPGIVLCIVEAMKLMNEIECDVSGKIVKILVENGTPVEYNQPLFLVDTA